MRRRLLFTYMSLIAVILLMIEVPLAFSHSLNAYRQLATTRAWEARELAREATAILAGRETAAAFEKRLRRYESSHQATVILVAPQSRVTAASRPDIHSAATVLHLPLAQALRGRSTRPSRDLGGSLRPGKVIVAEPVRHGDKVIGALGAVASGAVAQRDVERHTLLLIGIAVLALIAAGLASVPLSRWLFRPIQRFDDTVHAIIDGAYDVRVRYGGGPPEMDGLADAFNRMADHLVSLLRTQQAMVADASHQMRAPLTALRLRIELLESGVRPEARKQLHQAAAEIERLCALLDQLLWLARAEGGEQPVAPVDVAEVVATRVAAWEQAAARRQIRLLTLGTSGTVSACVPGHLEQILDVLIDNALQVSDADTSITIRHMVVGGHAHIYVTDVGIWASLGGSGAALGVLLGGLLTAGPGWPWVFLVNVPVGIVVFVALRVQLPPQPRAAARGRLDVVGAVLVTAGTGTLVYALIRAGDKGWATMATAGLVAAAVVLYGAFVVHQRRAASPLMDVRLLVRRPVAAGALLILVATALMIMVFFLGTFSLQDHRGFGALATGLLFLPVALATMVGATVAGQVIGSLGARALGVFGLLLAVGGMLIPALWDSTPALVTGIAVAAAGTGVLFVVASATALGQIEPHQAGLASGIVSTFHEFGASLGAAVVSSMAAASIAGTDEDGFSRGFTTGAVVAGVAAVLALMVTPGRAPAGESVRQ